mmetsp:Transcript_11497/g.39983  ORF Transcript_11497/g.39983 Transcript_11497/m.39983 type:complete len:239 (-) Transcript_11497:200-916(-)
MFEGEAWGLRALGAAGSMVTPEVHHVSELEGGKGSYLVTDFLDFGARADQAAFGEALARMHLAEPLCEEAKAGQFGFPVDNTIGATPQPNGWMGDWVEFFKERRLMHQCRLTGEGQIVEMGERLCERVDGLFEGAGEIKPALLHGDLWSGNIAGVGGEPSVFDPATYYGHHEAEFGMSWCASFGRPFWEAYHGLIPKAEGWNERHKLYTLYHYLNHYNLFGGGYKSQAVGIMRHLLSL